LFNASSTFTNYTIYDQTLILKEDFTIDESKLALEGIPYLTGTYIAYLITSNAGLTATITHMLLWNWDDLKGAWSWLHPRNLQKLREPGTYMFWRQTETRSWFSFSLLLWQGAVAKHARSQRGPAILISPYTMQTTVWSILLIMVEL
jgi:hypothetical protein